jgi:hypothetical protein
MPINAGSISLGHCYATAGGDVRKVIEVQGETVTRVTRGKLAFPTWDREKWHTVRREAFAYGVMQKVPSDWQRG